MIRGISWLFFQPLVKKTIFAPYYSNMKRIAFLGYHTDDNLGDPLICQTVERIYRDMVPEDTMWMPLNLRDCFKGVPMNLRNKFRKHVFVFCRKASHHSQWRLWDDLRVEMASQSYGTLLKDADWGIAAGGGVIHYRTHDSWIGVCAFIKACLKRNIPVVLNAVGVEGFEKNNHRCRLLSHYLSAENVKYISTRDDFSTLRQYLSGVPSKKIEKTVDPAIFCSQLFHIEKDPYSRTIGIGLIRDTIFREYHADYDMRRLPDYYASLCKGIERMGYEWEFFTNGAIVDEAIIPAIEDTLGRKIDVRVPHTAEELVATIARYKGIVSARMHSCIVAYALDIPAVAFVWNEKLTFWGKNIQKPQNFLPVDRLDALRALELLQKDLGKEYDAKLRKELEDGLLLSVKTAVAMLQNS